MPTREQQYLVRGPDGTVATVNARSPLGAARRYLVRHPRTPRDSELSVKPRLVDEDWTTYKVER